MLDLTGLTKKAKIFWIKQRIDELERSIKRSDTPERKIELMEHIEALEELEKED